MKVIIHPLQHIMVVFKIAFALGIVMAMEVDLYILLTIHM